MSVGASAEGAASGDGPRPGLRSAERPVYGAVVALVAALASIFAFTLPGQFNSLEVDLNDRLRIMLPPRDGEQDRRISILALTEETLAQFPYRVPVDRGFLADLVNVLAEIGVKGVVLDILFDQPTEVEKDEALIAALKNFPGPKVAAWGDESAGLIKAQHEYLQDFARRAGVTLGFANIVTDSDGVVRHFATRLKGIEGKRSMSGEMAYQLTGEEPPESGLIDWLVPKPGGATVFQQFPSHRILQFAEIPAMKARLENWLKDRIVFVGADLLQRDRHQTSMSVDVALERRIPGVVIQAQVLAQLLDGRVAPNATPEAIYAIVAGLALTGVFIGLSRWSLLWKAIVSAAAFAAYLAAVGLLARHEIAFLPVASALASFFIALSLAISLDNLLTRRDERFIRRAFSHYLEPSVVDRLAANPDSLRLGGDRREMSFIFTDIEGFTSMSEALPPDQLTRLLNDYFDGMSDIIIEHGGAIDKFIGDAVVAHFGAPQPMKDHALKALTCAESLDSFAEDFRRRNAHLGLGVTRIGVHTGVATVGNFGGRARFDYTAMGDAVNTAARLESSNKRYGTRIGVSQETAEAARAAAGPETRLPLLQTIGQVSLKGKKRRVTMYTVNTDADDEFVRAYEAAYSLMDVDAGKAKAAMEDLLRTNPGDPLARFHLHRLEGGETGSLIGAA